MAFRHADITGAEFRRATLESDLGCQLRLAARHGRSSITGGLLLGDDVATLLTSTERFPVSQDQRHTVRGRLSYQVTPSIWVALAASYGSGLPFEFTGDSAEAIEQYGQRIVDRVDLETGRVRPSCSLDASSGLVVAKRSKLSIRLQGDVKNLTNQLTVINFAGLFSGTAVGAPRSVAVRLQAGF